MYFPANASRRHAARRASQKAIATAPVWFQLCQIRSGNVREEFDLAMALSGCTSLTAITRDLVRLL